MLQSFAIDDDLAGQDRGAIEVTITLANGERRWCFFMSLAALSACGDWIDGTKTRFHYGAEHMIVVAAPLDRAIIERTLQTIARRGELLECTRKLA